MWFLVLLFVVLMLVGVTLVRTQREVDSWTDDLGPGCPAAPASLEGVLVAQLAGGEITREQYARAMAQLAARDEHRHPLSVPGPDS